MQLFAYVLEVNPLGFWLLVGVICYPPVIIIIFAIVEKIKEMLDKSTGKQYNTIRKKKERK